MVLPVIKKLLSKALLSVVMDKSAREKLADQQQSRFKPKKKSAKSDNRTPSTGPMDAANQAEALAQTIEDALDDARREAVNPVPRRNPAPVAKAPPQQRQTAKPKARPMTPEREKLIRDAVRIHQEKVQVLDELDPEAREKLAVMAMMVLDPESFPGSNNEGGGNGGGKPVDDIGGLRRTAKKRR